MNKITVQHPILPVSITFDPGPHTYTDSTGLRYTSATAFVSRFLPPFDAPAAAARIAARENRLEMEVLSEWEAKRDSSAAFGTLVHAYAEALIKGTTPPQPDTEAARRAFGLVDRALVGLGQHYDIMGAEQIIFDPAWEIAGTIDLPARNRSTGALAILDWKTCEEITEGAFGSFCLPPIANTPASKVTKYALQLSLYAALLTEPGYTSYPSEGEKVELAMIHVPHVGPDPIWRPVPYDAAAIRDLLGTLAQAPFRKQLQPKGKS